ncbi:GerAB/ArcD/ProY family transporter [Bacillus rhizoplanae]|uniref:GerAB/ArcD/ProY family transporter n=1 Tax=Bacillus rhizoplanae TaxID=2880966 RepID=UPI003D1EAAFD
MNKVNSLQLFCLLVLFELGSALLLDVGKAAGRDAWIVLLLGTVLGCVLYLLYVALFQQYPTLPLTSYAQRIVGKPIGWIIGFLYVLYFLYLSARVLRDFAEMMIIMAYNETSLLTASLLMSIVSIYAVHQGLQAFGRIACICFFLTTVITLLLIIFNYVNKTHHFDNVLPILEHGWGPILRVLFPTVLTVPFGELVAFTMIFPFLTESHTVRKAGIWAIGISGFQLALSALLHIAALGENIVSRAIFPTLTTVSLINIADFITRLDAFVVIVSTLFGFFKLTLFLYCAVIGLGDLLRMKCPNKLSIPMGLLMFVLSLAMASSFTEHLDIGLRIVPYYLHIPFQIVIPLLLFGISKIKKVIFR